jgi:hypothetical protein
VTDLIYMDVAAQEHEIPSPSERVLIEGSWYRVLSIHRRERSAEFVRDHEWALELIVAPATEDPGGAGVTADLPNDPRPLVARVEAEPPPTDSEIM